MRKRATLLSACAALALAGCPDSSPPPSGAPVSPARVPGPAGASVPAESNTPPASATALVLVLDTSGSMSQKVGADGSKLAIAQHVLTDDFLPMLSDDLYLAYYEFFHERSPLRRNGRLESPGWTCRERVMELVEQAHARGGTPIVQSLAQARNALQGVTVARKVIVLVTDGMDDKGPHGVERELDTCKSANVECYVVGFHLGNEGDYLAKKLGLGKGYFEANGGREALLEAMKSIAAAVER